MKSNSEVIKNCAQSIEELNEQIKQNEFLHKTTLFKRIDRQLFKLMVNLDDIDIENNPELEEALKALRAVKALLLENSKY